jgi:hypothetical protein
MATDETLKKAIDGLSGVFDMLGYQVNVNSVNITSKELAEEYRFVSSPTIRVNGVDICGEVKESNCKDCGDLCGDSVNCRVFVYEGREYEQPPAAMITDGILKMIYGQQPYEDKSYTLPDNLERFFAGKSCGCDGGYACGDARSNKESGSDFFMKKMSIYEPAMCCGTGLCGVSVDSELLRISTVLNTLKKNGIVVRRYNLSNAPQEFVSNKAINDFVNAGGVDELPAIVVDGEIVITGRYPTNEEFARLLGIPAGILGEPQNSPPKKTGGCGCSGGNCC